MTDKTVYQWLALISWLLGVVCVGIGFIDRHGRAGTVAAFLIVPFYVVGLWCVLFKPVGRK